MQISFDNGLTFVSAADVCDDTLNKCWIQLVELMHDDIREAIHDKYAPCSHKEFLIRYLDAATDDLILG